MGSIGSLGIGRKKPSIFDPQLPYGTPGIGDDPYGLGQQLPQGQFGVGSGPGGPFDPNRPPQAQQAPAVQQRWMDGGKFGVKDGIGLALGAIGDAFAMRNGGQAQTTPMLIRNFQARHEAQAAQAEYERRRADENTDWQNREQWKLDNTPPEHTAFVKGMAEAGINPSSQQGQKLMQLHIMNEANPMTAVDVIKPDGSVERTWQRAPMGEAGGGLPHGFDPNEWEVVPDPQSGAPPAPEAPMSAAPPQIQAGGLPPGIKPGSPEAYDWLRRTLPPNNFPMGSPLSRRRY